MKPLVLRVILIENLECVAYGWHGQIMLGRGETNEVSM